MNFMQKLKRRFTQDETEDVSTKYQEGMTKTRQSFSGKINDLIARYRTVDEDFFEELEEVLISADVGVMAVMDLIEELKNEVKRQNIKDTKLVRDVISEKLVEIYYGDDQENIAQLHVNEEGLSIILVVGVNGVGKTTSIGKLANKLKKEGKHVVLAAGDTFRAGAIEQLEEWGKRADVDVAKQEEGRAREDARVDGRRAT